MFATGAAGKTLNLSEDVDDHSGDGRNNEQQNHHGDGTELILVFKGGSEKTVSSPSFKDGVRFFKGRWFTPGNSFTGLQFATHIHPRRLRVIGLAKPELAGTLIHRCRCLGDMKRHDFGLSGERIHLAVEGSTGGTTLGLHLAADVIEDGKRVLWASVEMPDPARFSQLFQHLSLVESSRFHAMNFGGRFDRAVDALLEAATSLPSVGLVVMDDWCPSSGRIPTDRLEHIERVANECPDHITVLLVSKGSVDASGSTTDPIVARSSDAMERKGFAVWRLWRGKNGAQRTLMQNEERVELTLSDSGFVG